MTTITVQFQFNEAIDTEIARQIKNGDLSMLRDITIDASFVMGLNFEQTQRFKNALSKALLEIPNEPAPITPENPDIENEKITFYFKTSAKNRGETLYQYLEKNFPNLVRLSNLIDHEHVIAFANPITFIPSGSDMTVESFWSEVNNTWNKHHAGS